MAEGPTGAGEYLLEVRAEEIPARMLEPAVRELATRVFEDLMARNLAPREVETAFSPRRLALVLKGLPPREQDRTEHVLGPPTKSAFDAEGRPAKAAEGFARKCGRALSELRVVEVEAGEVARTHLFVGEVSGRSSLEGLLGKGFYLADLRTVTGQATGEVLAEVVPRVLADLAWPKTMVWGPGRGPWARPIRGIVSLLDGAPVPFELFGVAAGAESA